MRFLIIFFMLVISPLFATPVADILHVDGDITIIRASKPVQNSLIDTGFGIENFDAISTGNSSSLEISFRSETGLKGSLKLGPKTSLYLRLSSLKKEQVGDIELLTGSIKIKIDKMTGKSGLQIHTEEAQLTVKGTLLRVDTTPQGDVLLAALEGRVECLFNETTMISEPGSVIEVLQKEGLMKTHQVQSTTLEAYTDQWISSRIDDLKNSAPSTFKHFVQQYQKRYAEFSRAYDRLINESGTTLNIWTKQDQQGLISSKTNMIKEKNNIKSPLIGLQIPLIFLERYSTRIQDLQNYYKDGTIPGNYVLTKGYTVKEFYNQWTKDSQLLQDKLALIRYAMKLFSERNEGSAPADLSVNTDVDETANFFN